MAHYYTPEDITELAALDDLSAWIERRFDGLTKYRQRNEK